ncbi:DUF739 family protein [Anaeromicropila populeti]|uniref:HTH cro/C1-type domain-containing protein n=1 Tax=Anaeromicropila populeti TaxID=37658 RepID=A0A1I6M0D3_9FIRM|nr:DUF739 family protein [Anaeromicropila populeti]SFS08962.1 Protein of unknown function [Anaeromicropila populeti]
MAARLPNQKITYNFNLLRMEIKNQYKTQNQFADALRIGRASLTQKLNNHVKFNADEIYRSCMLLHIDLNHVALYFFQIAYEEKPEYISGYRSFFHTNL